MAKIPCAIIGSGNIGTDLMIKVMRMSQHLEMGAMVGIDPASDGLARAARLSVPTTHEGIEGLRRLPNYDDVGVVFDATSAGAHIRNNEILQQRRQEGDRPDAGGDRTVHDPRHKRRRQSRRAERQHGHLRRPGDDPDGLRGQARDQARDLGRDRRLDLLEIGRPRHARQHRRIHRDDLEGDREARRRRAGQGDHHPQPGRAAADHARHGVHAVAGRPSQEAIEKSVDDMVAAVQKYVPGYRLKQKVQFEHIGDNLPVRIPGVGPCSGLKTTIFLEVEGAAHYLPAYAGNLDIMTSAALTTADRWAGRQLAKEAA